MKKIKKSALTSLIFAIVFCVIAIVRFNTDEWFDSAFYIIAVVGFLIMFIAANREKK